MGLLADIKSFLVEELFLMAEMVAELDIGNIYLGSMPDEPANAITVYPTGGYPRDLSGDMVEEPTFMIKIRNTNYETGKTLCNLAKDLLHGQNNVVLGSGTTARTVLLIEQQSDVLNLGRDEKNRQLWSIN